MKKVLRFFGETFYELLLNKTWIFILIPLAGLIAWVTGRGDVVRLLGMAVFLTSLAALLFCLLQGLILRAVERELWRDLRKNARGGEEFLNFLRSRQGVWVGIAAGLVLVSGAAAIISEYSELPEPGLLIMLVILSLLYLVLMIVGPDRLRKIFGRNNG